MMMQEATSPRPRTAGPIDNDKQMLPWDWYREHTDPLTFRQSAFIVVQSVYTVQNYQGWC